ncbi:hypothetical protein PHAVU_010G070000 [Phaseolus vulgaris]|uniref:Adenosine kinase n=1 Tax=Phaseolus vulgaris TaxID=3885 RepID=V7AQ36_PHAVU|nr:hypothetical protein PHAVU_010G070000g [Phaseolus vulgaris]ESW06708.1 hypothetical protein PHAVU_010G070000g [Phaseolus vulgaris]
MLQVPNATGYIGYIGKDKFGEEMKKRCSLDGVHYYEIDTAPMGTCTVCVVGGESVSPDSIQLVVEHAATNSKTFMMNLFAPFICEFFKDALVKVLLYMDYVFGNENEARTFSKVQGWEVIITQQIGEL